MTPKCKFPNLLDAKNKNDLLTFRFTANVIHIFDDFRN